jgi:hypothetical protein
MPRIYSSIPLADRFWSFVIKGDGCWSWSGAKLYFGYGALNGGRRVGVLRAHRVSWEIHKGPIPTGMKVLHRCDNPECTNPDHLFLGAQRANVEDMRKKGRARGGTPAGRSHHRAKLSDADIIAIRSEYARGSGSLATIARWHGVSKKAVWNIVHGRHRL